MLTEKPVTTFLDELASSAPAPGGGSVAALSGALGAALVSMVCNLTVGKEKYADVQEDVEALLEKSEALRKELTDLLEEDVRAYTTYSKAAKMPRETESKRRSEPRPCRRRCKSPLTCRCASPKRRSRSWSCAGPLLKRAMSGR